MLSWWLPLNRKHGTHDMVSSMSFLRCPYVHTGMVLGPVWEWISKKLSTATRARFAWSKFAPFWENVEPELFHQDPLQGTCNCLHNCNYDPLTRLSSRVSQLYLANPAMVPCTSKWENRIPQPECEPCGYTHPQGIRVCFGV